MSMINVQEILLKDSIAKNNNLPSPLRENHKLAFKYHMAKGLYGASLLGVVVSAYYFYTKQYTGRRIYTVLLLSSFPCAYLGYYLKSKLKADCFKSFNCNEENFKDYLWFYRYAQLSPERYYEK